jgi:L-fucono-1,5-lactonase
MTWVVDAHHHLWDPARHAYPWMSDDLAAIRRRFGPDDLKPLLVGNGVDRSIVVQTIPSADETREFLATAADTEFIAGVVGWADLTDPSIGRHLAKLRSGSGGASLAGIRHQVHDEPDAGWLHGSEVRRGIQAVGEAGLVYDLLVRTRELPAALDVVRSLPEVSFVIDHIAKPRIAEGPSDSEWEKAMAPFSDCANVTCKLSGMVTEAAWAGWTPEDLRPYVRRALGWFGAERCMFGSDWPVCLLAATYDKVIEALRYAVSDLNPNDQEAIFGGNAIRVYGLSG